MDVDEIKRKIGEDKEKSYSSYRRYPVRFLFMELSNNTQNEIIDLVKWADGELLDLSDYIMKKDDGWMTKSRFIQIIKQYSSRTKDTYVLGFSEMIRFFSKKEIESTVLSLFDIENNNILHEDSSHRRIYFICFSMMDNVYKVLQSSFSRRDLIDPFINSEYEVRGQYREVCFVSNEYTDNIKTNKITSSVEWIGLWRHAEVIDFSSPIWCCSENLYKWHQKASPDNAFQIDVVKDTKDYLKKVYSLNVEFAYVPTESIYWDKLKDVCADMSSIESMQDVVKAALNVDATSTSALAGKILITESNYDKWLIKCYVSTYFSSTFLGEVLKMLKSNSKKEFLTCIWEQGYSISDTKLLEERVSIIKELNKYAESVIPEKQIRLAIYEGVQRDVSLDIVVDDSQGGMRLSELSKQTGCDISELRRRLWAYYIKIFKPAYTGLSKAEKEFVINLYSNDVLDKYEIKNVYSALYIYLFGQAENLISGKDEYKYYLKAYRESKVADKDNSYLQNYYENGCANATNLYSMYYDIQRQETVVASYTENSDLYILDGVGAEYLPLLVELIKKNEYDIEFCDYAACHLPSITDVNKGYLSELPFREWFLEFDREVIHGGFYKTAVNLRKAFDILETKVKDIISESDGKRIVITADHGATARARWTDTKKKYDFSTSDHEGRCCKILVKSDYCDTNDYIVYEDEIKPGMPYVISLNETSLYNKPKYEDHGGATIEEVLVPVIVACPHNSTTKIHYKVMANKLEVSGINKWVSFMITPDPDDEAYLVEVGSDKHILVKQGTVYTAELKSGREQDIVVVVDDEEYQFRTINKASKNMKGDDGFDD